MKSKILWALVDKKTNEIAQLITGPAIYNTREEARYHRIKEEESVVKVTVSLRKEI